MVMNQTLPGNFLSGDPTMMSEGQKQPHVCSIEVRNSKVGRYVCVTLGRMGDVIS